MQRCEYGCIKRGWGPPAGRDSVPAPCKGLRPLTHFGGCLWSAFLQGSRGVTDAPRRTRAASPCGVVRPPCRARRITAALRCSVGDEIFCTLLYALWLESVSGAHRVLASPRPVCFLGVVRGGPHLRWGTGVTTSIVGCGRFFWRLRIMGEGKKGWKKPASFLCGEWHRLSYVPERKDYSSSSSSGSSALW